MDVALTNDDDVAHTVRITVEDPNASDVEEKVELDPGDSEVVEELIPYTDASRNLAPEVSLADGRTASHELYVSPDVERFEVTISDEGISFETIEQ